MRLIIIFSFASRLGEPFPYRGRQTLCKYYDGNEILNEQLLQIKSAQTVSDFERLFSNQLRHNQDSCDRAKSIEPYYDVKEVLHPLKPFASESCLCTNNLYRFNANRLANERQRSPSPASTSNAIKRSKYKNSIDEFVNLASECYDKCINIYLNNLDDCNRRAEIVGRHSIKSPSGYTGKRSLKSRKINDFLLANQINKLNINLDTYHRSPPPVISPENFFITRQSTLSLLPSSQQTMSCNDANNNSNESTSQLKDPPKIILSDHSTNQPIQEVSNKEFIDRRDSVTDKNCLAIPIENYYSSEARPP